MNASVAPGGTWQETRTPEGKIYYYNSVTRATRWDKPPELLNPLEQILSTQPWKEYTAPDGRKYYSHSETRETTWSMPQQYRDALDRAQNASRPMPPTPTFVAGGNSASTFSPIRDSDPMSFNREPERRDFSATNGITVAGPQEHVPDYSTFEEAEAAFMKLLRRSNVQPDWSWEQAMRATIRDPQYRALKDPKDRKVAFEKYAVEVRQQEREKAKDRLAKLRTDFGTMLRRHPEIKHYSRWITVRPIIEGETIFKSTDKEDERKLFFEEYIVELKKEQIENQNTAHKTALVDLTSLLKSLDLEPYTRWSEAHSLLEANETFQEDDNYRTLSKSEILTAFENHIKSLERIFNDERQSQKASRTRQERQTRDQYLDLLQELRGNGKIRATTKWKDILPDVEDDPRYVAVLGQPGSTPLDMFWDVVEEEERSLRGVRNAVYDVLEDAQHEVTPKTTFDAFLKVMTADRRTANVDRATLELIFARLVEKVMKRSEDEKHAADRQQRRAIDALRSRIKRTDPQLRSTDTWADVRPRLERYEEFQALETDDQRKVAFDKAMKRVREKEEDAEKDRERRRMRRNDDDREMRNGSRTETRRRRLSKTPEVDVYEAERRKAMADREKQYHKASALGLSPPPSSARDRERDRRDDRHGRLVDRSPPPPRSAGGYDRERRDREDDRERLYRARGDPRGSRDELNYGEENRSVTSSDRRRRRDSDGDSINSSGHKAKRYRPDRRPSPREKERVRSPEVKKETPPAEPSGVHSGSEEGEIEED